MVTASPDETRLLAQARAGSEDAAKRAVEMPRRDVLTVDTALYLFSPEPDRQLLVGPLPTREALLVRFGGALPQGSEIVDIGSDVSILCQVDRIVRSGGQPPFEKTAWVLVRNTRARRR